MLRRFLLNPSALLPLLLGRDSPTSTAAAALPAPLHPLPHFIERLWGGAGTLSTLVSPDAAGARSNSLTLQFLRDSCGLAEKEAEAVGARLRLRSTKNAHAVLALLRNIGFAPAAVARLIVGCPSLLACTSFAAKVDFCRRELGLSDADVRRILLASPYRIANNSLDSRLRHNHKILKGLLGTDENVRAAVKQAVDLILGNMELVLLPKLKILRDHGATEEGLVKLVIKHPKALIYRSNRFDDGLAAMKDLGVGLSSGIFPYAFGVFAKTYQTKWDRRMENFLSLGWTEEQVRKAFVRHPYCMAVSDDKVRQLMKFFTEKLGWTPEYVAKCPTVLSFSYEKRILPRCMVLNLLASKGAIKSGLKQSHLMIAEKKFIEKYITTYQEVIPELLEAYNRARAAGAVK